MKKFLLTAGLLVAAASAQAQSTVGQAFNVTATMNARCVSNNTAPSDVAFGAYTPFTGPATAAPTTAISFRCTRNLSATPSAALSAAAGSIAGLDYTLAVGGGVKASGSGAPTTSGTYDVYTYTVTGAMATGQAGDATASAVAQVHTLTITY